ncbi:GntR family transcriptional regulator, transcriptional repressor for pyruvate dehydrogenase complex [Maridesulfovibrio ferrireducens]|uniref:GntR family transcriptional regulator, transcriptional repressor for pyruvate dehydrogenase complex n=1 Tax=Maridesulfovibrio ferrireducens TaxID=246191 RepID=A0A1G9H6Z5_9BACT|nr:FadR/GntR family transcriptional regulator [Maridesulfovibrio ferrireducens]SDL08544.1 GntR family transcriptional regulator, transcriptional repressor for pyruvate dehydrogenase complex [Maridesulfovibrio ferrireducens]
MDIKKQQNPVYESVAKQITELIKSGELQQGDKLPSERNLAEKFKVSRSSVREAIKALVHKNLVESKRGDGTYICAHIDADIIEAFTEAFADQKKRLSDIFQFRKVIEPQIAALAAISIDDETLNRMKVIVCNQEIRIRSGQGAGDLDTEFHLEIAKASGNSIFPDMMEALSKIIKESRSQSLQNTTRLQKSMTAHFDLLKAFEKHDSALAQKIMRQHIEDVESAATGSDSL